MAPNQSQSRRWPITTRLAGMDAFCDLAEDEDWYGLVACKADF